MISVANDGEAVKCAYEMLTATSPDVVDIHKGSNLDLRSLGSACVGRARWSTRLRKGG